MSMKMISVSMFTGVPAIMLSYTISQKEMNTTLSLMGMESLPGAIPPVI